MDDLNNKLKALDLEFLHGVPVHLTDEMIAQIHQAYKEAGYSTFRDRDGTEWLPGGVWYDRFVKELGEPQTFVGYGYDSTGYEDDDVLEAAKKASGI